jgi:hypothetical protein
MMSFKTVGLSDIDLPPDTGPDFVREIWHNFDQSRGGEYEPEAVHRREDYWDAA